MPTLSYGKKISEPQDFCLNFTWKNNLKNSTFAEVGDQKLCENTYKSENLKWKDSDPTTGISFPQYRFEPMEDWKCRESDTGCRLKCEAQGGQMEDEVCYSLNLVHKICVKVELDFLNGLKAEEAEIVTGVKFKGGCLPGGEVVSYKRFN